MHKRRHSLDRPKLAAARLRPVQGCQVTVQFERVDSIRDGSEVRIVKVGSIVSETLDLQTHLATARLSIYPA